METKVWAYGEFFTCKEFYDVDTSMGGVSIYNEEGEFEGDLWGLEIPDPLDTEEVEEFEEKVIEYLSDNVSGENEFY